MRVLVCGDRNWDDVDFLGAVLTGIRIRYEFDDTTLSLIEGDAPGADRLAGRWAELNTMNGRAVNHLKFPAKWAEYGNSAGPIRNQQMLDEGKPEMVVAFHDDLANSKGTGDMVRRAKKAGLPVYVVSHP